MTVDIEALERRVRRLEDVEQIWRLFMSYRRHLDQRDFAAYAALFVEDGEWLGGLGRARGPAEIEALLRATLEIYPDDSTRTHHLVDNPTIEIDGDRATAESTWCFVVRDNDDRPQLWLLGHYSDVLVRTAAGWRFLRREAHLDMPYEALDRA